MYNFKCKLSENKTNTPLDIRINNDCTHNSAERKYSFYYYLSTLLAHPNGSTTLWACRNIEKIKSSEQDASLRIAGD